VTETFTSDGLFTLTETIPGGIVLGDGESLFIALEFVGDYSASPADVLCAHTCLGAPTGTIDLWSTSTTAPYNWTPLEDYGISYSYTYAMIGS